MAANGKRGRCAGSLLEFYRVAFNMFSWELALPARKKFLCAWHLHVNLTFQGTLGSKVWYNGV